MSGNLYSTEYKDKVAAFKVDFSVAREDFVSSIGVETFRTVVDAGTLFIFIDL